MCIRDRSAYVGVQNGIKRLSNVNMVLVISFLAIILVIGPTTYIIENSINTMSFFFSRYIDMSLTTGTNISIDWTVFYWAWWYALAPMVGTFLVNISNNKTLREIILGTIFIGSFGCIFSMLILSNLSISLFENNTLDSPSIIANNLMSREQLVVETISQVPYLSLIHISEPTRPY